MWDWRAEFQNRGDEWDLVPALSPPCLTCHDIRDVRVRFLVKAQEVKVVQVLTCAGCERGRQATTGTD